MVFHVIKFSKKCASRDWSERVHCISIEHAPYVTRVHCWDTVHAVYVIGTSTQFTIHFIKEIKKLVPGALLSYISTWKIFGNTREVREALAFGSCLSILLSSSWRFPRAYITQQCTQCVFYFFVKKRGFSFALSLGNLAKIFYQAILISYTVLLERLFCCTQFNQ